MEMALGIICAILSGAGIMYLFLQTTGGLRKEDLERELLEKIKDLKLVEKAYNEDLRKRMRDVEDENEKWTPNSISSEKQSKAIQEAISNILKNHKPL